MLEIFKFFLFCVTGLSFFYYCPAWSHVSVKSSLSSGFFRNVDDEFENVSGFDFYLGYTGEDKQEFTLELALNNYLIEGEWGVYPIQAKTLIPLGSEISESGRKRMELNVGRLILTEALDIHIFDGGLFNYNLSPKSYLSFYGGGVSVIEDTKELSFDKYIVGSTFRSQIKNWSFLIGNINSSGNNNWQSAGYAGFFSSLYDWQLKPSIISNAKYNFSSTVLEKAHTELSFSPINSMILAGGYEVQFPQDDIFSAKSQIYKIFAVDSEKSWFIKGQFNTFKNDEVFTSYRNISFLSNAGNQEAQNFEIGYQFRDLWGSFEPVFLYLDSYGGKLYSYSIDLRYFLSTKTRLRINGNLSDFQKLTGIEGKAWHGRFGFDTKLDINLDLLAFVEIERNHLFEFDGRAIVYISHFIY